MPIVSTEGIAEAGSWTPAPASPVRPGTEPAIRGATTGGTTGAAPRIGATGTGSPVLTTGVPSEPAILHTERQKLELPGQPESLKTKAKVNRYKPRGSAAAIQFLH